MSDPLIQAEQQMLMRRPWHVARKGSLWAITGDYPRGAGQFTNCVAVVLPSYVHGTDKPAFAMLPPLPAEVVLPEQITHARRLRLTLDDDPDTEVSVYGLKGYANGVERQRYDIDELQRIAEKATRERDEARAAVARVEALAEDAMVTSEIRCTCFGFQCDGTCKPIPAAWTLDPQQVLAALHGDAEEASDDRS